MQRSPLGVPIKRERAGPGGDGLDHGPEDFVEYASRCAKFTNDARQQAWSARQHAYAADTRDAIPLAQFLREIR